MTVRDYLRVLREQWLVLLLAILLGLGGAAAAFFLRPAEYTAKLTLYVSSQGGDTTSAAYQGAQLSQQRVTSYVELVSSRRVSEDVIRQLRLTGTPEELSRQITATSVLDSVLIDVAVVDESPQRAAELANTVGRVFTRLVDELERPVDRGAPQAVAVRVVQPAAVPLWPSSTGLPVTLALGLLAGLAVGVGGALARNSLDVSVKSPDQLREAAGAPNLGTVAHDSNVPKRPLTVHEDPQSPRSEAFRQLRTNLQFVDVDNPRKVLLITSSMPSEGKTTTLVNLAIAMASAGNRVLVIEADLRRPKVADLLGMERTVGLTSVLSGRVRTDQVIQPWGGGAFDVLASGPLPPNPSELLASKHMEVDAHRPARAVRRGTDRLSALASRHRRRRRRPGDRRRDPGLPLQADHTHPGGGGRSGVECRLRAGAGHGVHDGAVAPVRAHTRSTTRTTAPRSRALRLRRSRGLRPGLRRNRASSR